MVAVVSDSGEKMSLITEMRARQLLKSGRAKIYLRRPKFTIQLLDGSSGETHILRKE